MPALEFSQEIELGKLTQSITKRAFNFEMYFNYLAYEDNFQNITRVSLVGLRGLKKTLNDIYLFEIS